MKKTTLQTSGMQGLIYIPKDLKCAKIQMWRDRWKLIPHAVELEFCTNLAREKIEIQKHYEAE